MGATGDGGSSKWNPPGGNKRSEGDGGSSKWNPPKGGKRSMGPYIMTIIRV